MSRWTAYDESDFKDYYWDEVAPVMEADGLDPTEPPTAVWMEEHGYGGYYQAISKHTGLTFLDFAEQELGITKGTDHVRSLDVEDAQTRELVYRFAEDHMLDRKDRARSTVWNVLYHHECLCQELRGCRGHDDLVRMGSNDIDSGRAYEIMVDVFDILDAEYSDGMMEGLYTNVKNFYEYLRRRHNPVEHNPIIGISEDFDWDPNDEEPLAVTPEQVRAIASVAETTAEQALVVLLCAAGIRSNEVGTIHRDTIVFEPEEIDTPILDFDERKNGPGTVVLVYGANVLQDRIDELEAELGDDWNGYLFPSPNRNREYLTGSWIREGFTDLVERAARETDVDMTLPDESLPSPQTARRYWYNQHSKGINMLLAAVQDIAHEQGSEDPEVVLDKYMSTQRRLSILRDHMAETLTDAFAGTPIESALEDDDVGDMGSVYSVGTPLETPVDRFLDRESTETSTDSDGWLSGFDADESADTTPTGTTKTALILGALAIGVQLAVVL